MQPIGYLSAKLCAFRHITTIHSNKLASVHYIRIENGKSILTATLPTITKLTSKIP